MDDSHEPRPEQERGRPERDPHSNVKRVAERYPYWLIVGGFGIFAIVMIYLAYVLWTT